MRHKIAGKKIGRNSSWRRATVRDIAKATLIKERICTTKTKAKEARKLVDRLITLGKKDTLAARRRAYAILCDHKLVSVLFKSTSPRFNSRKGGYTRIILLGNRRGDNAQLAFLELTEKAEVVVSKPKSKATKKKSAAKAEESQKGTQKAEEKTASEKKLDFSKISEGQGSHKKDKKQVAKDKNTSESKLGGIKKIFKRKTT